MATTAVMADITLPYDILSRKIGERTARVGIASDELGPVCAAPACEGLTLNSQAEAWPQGIAS